jgi:hypothetical protein
MHLKVFVKLKKTLKTLSSGQKNPKKPKKTQKTQKNQKNPKNPLGWVFLKKPGFFPTLDPTENGTTENLPSRGYKLVKITQ